jgi:hypothetical protein
MWDAGPAALRAHQRRAEPLRGVLEDRARGPSRVHRRPGADDVRIDRDAAELGRNRVQNRVEGGQPVGAQVTHQFAVRRDHVERLPGAHDRRDGGQALGAVGVACVPYHAGHLGQRQQRAAALVRGRPGMGGPAVGLDPQRGGRLALENHRLPLLGVALTRLEAQAGIEAGEEGRVAKGRGAPFLVIHQQHGHLGVERGAGGQLAHHTQRQRHAALHVNGPRTGQAVASAGQRAVFGVRHDSVEMAEQEDAHGAGSREAADEVRRVADRGARDALDTRLWRKEGPTEGNRLLGARHVAGRGGDAHESLQLSFGLQRHALGGFDHRGSRGFAKWKLVMRIPVLR